MAFFPEFLCCLCMSSDYSSVFIVKENTQGRGKTVRSSETELPGSQKAWATGNSHHQQDVCKRERWRERERGRERGGEREGENE